MERGSSDREYELIHVSLVFAAKAPGWTSPEATKQLLGYAIESFTLPGEPGFPLNNVYAAPASRLEGGTSYVLLPPTLGFSLTLTLNSDTLRAYLTHARQETATRLIERVYDASSGGKASKWWMCFQVSLLLSSSLQASTDDEITSRSASSWARVSRKVCSFVWVVCDGEELVYPM